MRWLLDSLNFVFLSMLGGLLHSHDRHWSTRAFDFVIRNFSVTPEITKIRRNFTDFLRLEHEV